MRQELIGIVAAITILSGSVVRAGDVEIGFVDAATFDRWQAGERVEVATDEMVCTPAKFDGSPIAQVSWFRIIQQQLST